MCWTRDIFFKSTTKQKYLATNLFNKFNYRHLSCNNEVCNICNSILRHSRPQNFFWHIKSQYFPENTRIIFCESVCFIANISWRVQEFRGSGWITDWLFYIVKVIHQTFCPYILQYKGYAILNWILNESFDK